MVALSGQALTAISTVAAAVAAIASVIAIGQTTKGRHDERIDRDRRELAMVARMVREVGEEADQTKMHGQPFHTFVIVRRQLSVALGPFAGELPACHALAESTGAPDALTKLDAARTEVDTALEGFS